MEMIKKLLIVAVMIGAGAVQCAQDDFSQSVPRAAAAQEDAVSLAPSYRSHAAQAEDTVSYLSLPPSYALAVDFFDEEALVAEAFERFPVLTGDTRRLIHEEEWGDNGYNPILLHPAVYEDRQVGVANERNGWLSSKKQRAIEEYFFSKSERLFAPKAIDARQVELSFRQFIEAAFQYYVSFIQQVALGNTRDGNPYLGIVTHNREKRMETKQLLDTILSSIKTIHRQLLRHEKNSFHSRSSSDKQEINRGMEELNAVFQRFYANVSFSDDVASYYAPASEIPGD